VRRGFSLYAPLVGIILVSMAFIIMGALMSEENARISYLRMLRAAYEYILPTQTMRYDALTAFSVAARIYFENAAFSVKNGSVTTPDVKGFLDSFIKSFTFAPGGQIVETHVNWKQGDAAITTSVKGDYLILTITPRGVGPTYTIKLAAGQGREETITVPIFTGKTTIYIPYPVGRVKSIAKEIYASLSNYAQSGHLAYGYCTAQLQEGDTTPVLIFGSKREGGKQVSWREMEDMIRNFIENQIGGVEIDEIRNIRAQSIAETYAVDAVDFLSLHHECEKFLRDRMKQPLVLAVPEDGPKPLYCNYIIGFDVSGKIKENGGDFPFTIHISLPAYKAAHTKEAPRFCSSCPYYSFFDCSSYGYCRQFCQCGSVCAGDETSDECIHCLNRCNECKEACKKCVEELQKTKDTIEKSCSSTGIRTYILSDDADVLRGLYILPHTSVPQSKCIIYQNVVGVYCQHPWHECKEHGHNG